jgi:hypothetical protein
MMNMTRRFFSREPGVDGMPANSHAAKEKMWAYLDAFVAEHSGPAPDGVRGVMIESSSRKEEQP